MMQLKRRTELHAYLEMFFIKIVIKFKLKKNTMQCSLPSKMD